MNTISSHIFCLLDRFNTWVWRRGFDKSQPHGLVLMYHHVTDEDIEVDPCCKCKVAEFREQLIRLKADGYTFVTMDAVSASLKEFPNYKFATVSFDDVPKDVLQNAVPILRNLQIPYTLFVTSKYARSTGYISENQLKDLSKDPLCTIGAHTMTHPMLRKSKNSYDEMNQSKEYLESLIGKEVKYLAYPYGKYSSISFRVRQQAKQIGFKCAFGTIEAPITNLSANSMFYLPRMVFEL